jgi:hypothetical protein
MALGLTHSTRLRHYATSRKIVGSRHDYVTIFFFNLPNPSSWTMALGLTQPLTEMITEDISGANVQQVRKADNITAICEPITKTMRDPRHLTRPPRPVNKNSFKLL